MTECYEFTRIVPLSQMAQQETSMQRGFDISCDRICQNSVRSSPEKHREDGLHAQPTQREITSDSFVIS